MNLRLAAPADIAALAALHRTGFSEAWSVQSLMDLLESPGAFAVLAEANGDPQGFVLVREAAGEAEILTIAVQPEQRRHGLGRRLLAAAARRAAEMGATTLFLEVAVDNQAALALYYSLGFVEVGRRKAYYARPSAPAANALILKVDVPLPRSRLGNAVEPG